MRKKKIALYGAVALFAISGVAALPSGNFTGGVGCIVIAAVCFLLARKPKKEERQQVEQIKPTIETRNESREPRQDIPASAVRHEEREAKAEPPTIKMSAGKIADTIRTKIVGVTFDNEDGENRQDILASMTGDEEIEIEKYTYNGKPAAYVKWGDRIIGNLSAKLAEDLERKYPNAVYSAEILEISGGGGERSFGCNIEIDIIVES